MADRFIARWQHREGGQERANYSLFLTELCDVIGVERPQPAGATHEHNDYVFERVVKMGGVSLGRIDLYKRHSFVLEAKQSRWPAERRLFGPRSAAAVRDEARRGRGAARAWEGLMLSAKRQAQDYARALPASHGWPPFLLVCDVGHCIEVYADVSGRGDDYVHYPDRRSFRIYLDDLRRDAVRDQLRRIWNDPGSLAPARDAAPGRGIAERLAALAPPGPSMRPTARPALPDHP
ncbi:type IIL restriction-modification enzyme MmeI [Rhodopseudomonas palustris]|uniref:MmeI-like N-terminal domain-containing protein n=1 Tax=Rhodopseudomonas palustris TaxID=1076 RepID=A0A418V1S3_RHOPL|nr:type IIL restriction-modification enzyme MmeI [Rhodopseudomonas palustris]RJF69827.1 hypothetical protein D4Q52_19515 [Rhodopseudomonas palustris]